MKDISCEDGACEVNPHSTDDKSIVTETAGRKLLYIGDPMCSWCWGIANHLDRLRATFREIDFEIILGGLRPGGGEEWTHEFREMLRTHWQHVQEASGQPFDFGFLEREQFDYDTEPPARAVRVVRDIAPEKEWSFFKALQRKFYAENTDILDLHELEKICNSLSIDYNVFENLFISAGYKQLVNMDFMRAQQMGIRGFPSVVLQDNEKYYAVSYGYSPYEKLLETVRTILEYRS